jgi:dolichol-phosphate mannosyltransferase
MAEMDLAALSTTKARAIEPATAHVAAPEAAGTAVAAELAVVIPTMNERDNVPILVQRLNRVLAGIAWEAIFVDDDSPDGTADLVREIGRRQPHIRVVQRLGRRGLSSACIEGILASSAPYVAVMDGDLQHDEALLPAMLAEIKAARLDIVIASRYAGSGSVGDWQRSRVLISTFAGRLGRTVIKAELSDPMSGFFMITRDAFAATMRSLSGQGFKILLDLFASSPRPLAFAEMPLTFRRRLHGESKLDALVAWEYLLLLVQKLAGPAVPVRFLLFAAIGALGLGAHLAVLWLATNVFFLTFALAQSGGAGGGVGGPFFMKKRVNKPDPGVAGATRWGGRVWL